MSQAQAARPRQADRTPEQSLERAASILERFGRTGTADLGRRRFADTSLGRTVVVLGEVKRGKSSLVNALVGRRDLLPADVDLCSGLPARVHATAGPADESSLVVHYPATDVTEPREHLHRWARLDERSLPSGDDMPTGVAVEAGGSPLDDVVLVDTPGAGGLDEGAVRMALDEAGRAGVLVMVCDATTPITQGEMDILARAQAVVGHVVVAVTKTDKNLRRWRSIVADDRRLIERHLGLRPPVIGVSSLRALDALELDPRRREHVERVSGIADLRAAILHGLSLGDSLAALAGLRTVRAGLADITSGVESDLRVAREADTVLPELEERKAELEAVRAHSMQWEQYLARNLSLARTHIASQVDRELDEIRDRWTKKINASGMKVLRSRPQIFTAQIERELAGVVERSVAEILRALEGETARLFPGDPTVWAQVAAPAMATIVPPDVSGKAVGKKSENLFDPAMLSMGVIGAGMLTAVIPIAPVAGGLWVGINLAYRAMKNGKTALLQWLRETVGTARTSAMRLVDTVSTTARPEIVIRYRDHLRRESESVQKRIDDAKRTQRQSAAEREKTVARQEKNLGILRATIAEIDAHTARLEALR